MKIESVIFEEAAIMLASGEQNCCCPAIEEALIDHNNYNDDYYVFFLTEEYRLFSSYFRPVDMRQYWWPRPWDKGYNSDARLNALLFMVHIAEDEQS